MTLERSLGKCLSLIVPSPKTLKYADASNNTLVVVTADHETSGLGIMGGDLQSGTVLVDFLTVDHTGIPVPLFAYGPQAHTFRGSYENTEIFKRIVKILFQEQ